VSRKRPTPFQNSALLAIEAGEITYADGELDVVGGRPRAVLVSVRQCLTNGWAVSDAGQVALTEEGARFVALIDERKPSNDDAS
jgi:hypothetical protein